MKLSIIIPAYNAEEHILVCLTSVLEHQKIAQSDFEVIVINDGSTDNTAKIVKDLAENRFPNIHLVTQENKGNGSARNAGVELSKGNYIYFLDADDYLAKNTLHTIIELAEKNDVDIIGFKTLKVKNSKHKKTTSSSTNFLKLPVTTGIDFLGSHNYDAEVWWYMTKKSFYLKTGTTFYNRRFVQDAYITPTLFSKAEKVIFMPYDVHRYRMSLNSITRKKTISHLNQHFDDLSFSIKKLYELRNQLIKNGVQNTNCLTRLHVKQQRYVFILITRFIKSKTLPIKQLKTLINTFKEFEAYPLTKLMAIEDYKSLSYRIFIFIFSREWLIYPLIKIYRIFK